MFSQVVPMISSFATQCASVEFETILSRDLVNVLVQLLVLLSACKHQVNNYLKGGQAKHKEILVFWQHNFEQTNIRELIVILNFKHNDQNKRRPWRFICDT